MSSPVREWFVGIFSTQLLQAMVKIEPTNHQVCAPLSVSPISINLLQELVKIEAADSNGELVVVTHNSKAVRRGTNKDLPPRCQDGNRFCRHFIPTFLKLAAAGDDPWVVVDKETVNMLQMAWKKVYGKDIELVVMVNDSVFYNVSRPSTHALYLN